MNEDAIHLKSVPYGGARNGLVNPNGGLRVAVFKGEMGASINGRTTPVKRPPVFIHFVNGHAFVTREGRDALGNKVDMYALLGAQTREEAVAAIKALGGYGSDFILDTAEADERPTGKRTPIGAAK